MCGIRSITASSDSSAPNGSLGDASAAGCNYQSSLGTQAGESIANRRLVVGNDLAGHDLEVSFLERHGYRGAPVVGTLATGRGVADRHHGGAQLRCRGGHL